MNCLFISSEDAGCLGTQHCELGLISWRDSKVHKNTEYVGPFPSRAPVCAELHWRRFLPGSGIRLSCLFSLGLEMGGLVPLMPSRV